MAVYVDAARVPATVGRNTGLWSHLAADTTDELLAFGQRIGLKPQWIRNPGTSSEHFGVTEGLRAKAIKAGARPVTIAALSDILTAKRAGTATPVTRYAERIDADSRRSHQMPALLPGAPR